MEVTGVAQLQAWRERRLPPVEEVRPGLWSIPLPNATSGIRYVLCHVFEHVDGSGLTLVDPGWQDEESWTALTSGLAGIGRSVREVRTILVTHFHPDHLGLAHAVAKESGARVLMHEAELPALPRVPGDTAASTGRTEPFWRRHGLSEEELAQYRADVAASSGYAGLHPPHGTLQDGEEPEVPGWRLRAVHTPGHTDGHLCFHLPAERLLLTGDHLLPRITPNVSAYPHSVDDPLGAYLDSLDRVGVLDATEVLPAHEYRFAGLASRVAQVQEHHVAREAELRELLERAGRPVSAAEVSRGLRWSRPFEEIAPPMQRAALAESLAHLVHLERLGGARREAAADGAVRWVLDAEGAGAAEDGDDGAGQDNGA